jgi:hypothetical protein
VLERAAADQLREHLERNQLLEPLQSAYRPGHSTETALVKIQNDICCALGERKVVLLVLLDLSAAFDTVNHELLLQTLSEHKVGNTAHDWFRSYLIEREQTVKSGGSLSNPTPLESGVPQGSVLGPLLFSVYSSSLGRVLRNLNADYHLYADDTQIYVSVSPDHLDAGTAQLENCIYHVKTWMNHHRLKMNESKTEYLVLSNRNIARQIQPPTLDVCGHEVMASASAKNIGVTFDSHMALDVHVNNVCKCAYMHLHCIAKVKRFLDRQSLETFIHAFITSRLDSCNAILMGLNQQLTRKLQRVQNAAARLLTNTRKCEHITPVLRELHWLPVVFRIEFKVLVLTFKCMKNIAPMYLCNLVQPYSSRCNLRSNDLFLLHVPFTDSQFIRNHAFSYVGPSHFNALPLSVRSSTSLDVFKRRLKTHLFKQCYNV